MTTREELLAGSFYDHAKPLLVCDTECTPNFWSIGFLRVRDGQVLVFEKSHRQKLDVDRLRAIMLTHTIITYNGMSYDMPMIWLAINGASNARLKEANDQIIGGRLRYWQVEEALGVSIPWKVSHIDLISVSPAPPTKTGGESFPVSLKTLQGRLHGKVMWDLPYAPDRRLSEAEMDVVLAYMTNDLDATYNVLLALKEPLELRAAAGADLGMNFMSKSDSQMGEAIIKKRVEQITGERVQRVETLAGSTFPYRPPEFAKLFDDPRLVGLVRQLEDTRFIIQTTGKVDLPAWLEGKQIVIGETTYAMGIGGLHSTESNRALYADDDNVLIDVDVESQYPNIILSLGLYPKATGRAFLTAYSGIKADRVQAKERGKVIVRELDALRSRQADTADARDTIKKSYLALDRERDQQKNKDQSLKIALNGGGFGKLGSRYSALYAPHLLIAVTLTGQLSLLLLISWAEAAGIPAVSANTDGVVFRCPRDKRARLMEITARWEQATSFKLEFTEYQALYSQGVNAYIATKPDGKVKRKGALANPLADGDLRGQLMKNPAMGVLTNAVVAWLTEGVPIEQSVYGCRDIREFVTVVNVTGGGTWRGDYLGKVVRYIWSTDGDEIFYKTPHPTTGNHKKVPRSDGCRPLMELPEVVPDDIDYDRYIAEAKEILKDIGAEHRPAPVKPLRIYRYNAMAWFAVAAA